MPGEPSASNSGSFNKKKDKEDLKEKENEKKRKDRPEGWRKRRRDSLSAIISNLENETINASPKPTSSRVLNVDPTTATTTKTKDTRGSYKDFKDLESQLSDSNATTTTTPNAEEARYGGDYLYEMRKLFVEEDQNQNEALNNSSRSMDSICSDVVRDPKKIAEELSKDLQRSIEASEVEVSAIQ